MIMILYCLVSNTLTAYTQNLGTLHPKTYSTLKPLSPKAQNAEQERVGLPTPPIPGS